MLETKTKSTSRRYKTFTEIRPYIDEYGFKVFEIHKTNYFNLYLAYFFM